MIISQSLLDRSKTIWKDPLLGSWPVGTSTVTTSTSNKYSMYILEKLNTDIQLIVKLSLHSFIHILFIFTSPSFVPQTDANFYVTLCRTQKSNKSKQPLKQTVGQ